MGQDSSVDVDEQVLVLVAVLGDLKDGLDLGAGEHLDKVGREAGEGTILESTNVQHTEVV